MMAHLPSEHSVDRGRQTSYEFKSSLVYTVNFRPYRATQRPSLKDKKEGGGGRGRSERGGGNGRKEKEKENFNC